MKEEPKKLSEAEEILLRSRYKQTPESFSEAEHRALQELVKSVVEAAEAQGFLVDETPTGARSPGEIAVSARPACPVYLAIAGGRLRLRREGIDGPDAAKQLEPRELEGRDIAIAFDPVTRAFIGRDGERRDASAVVAGAMAELMEELAIAMAEPKGADKRT